MSFGDDVKRQQYYAIVQSLASSDPFVTLTPGNPALCHYCGAQKSTNAAAPTVHSPSCLWSRAVAVKSVTP